MYFKKTAVSTAIVAALLSTSAIAEQGVYMGVSYADLKYDNSEDKFSTPAVFLNVGYQFNPYLAVEGRLGTGAGDDTHKDSPTETSTSEINSYYGVFGRFGMPINDTVYPYLQLGYGKTKFDFKDDILNTDGSIKSSVSSSASTDEELAWGGGLNINFSETFTGNIEYTNYFDENDVKIDGVAVGLQYRF